MRIRSKTGRLTGKYNEGTGYMQTGLFYVFPAKLQKADLQVTLSSPSIVLIAEYLRFDYVKIWL